MTKVLCLGPEDSDIFQWLANIGEEVVITSEKINLAQLKSVSPDIIVSHGYRHIITADVIAAVEKGRLINLHISYLPWNRGADPNFWSFYDNTPKGFTIHCIDDGLDTGDILYQRAVDINASHTLKSSYELLQTEMCKAFRDNWVSLKGLSVSAAKQAGSGSYHRASELKAIIHRYPKHWDTPVADI
ncbi:MAG: hypothetical protein MK185_09035 [Saccharospirillaceae bacterium]|nr:hypothetical protein A3759_02670 [Thalassolituus sp. HI0120]KZZ50578.1 hypothetical protein A3759_25190 [Thalassolituus sp. HI0120]MCH2040764.1 hypothetical protein [Saccharospirillaceae bacterium]